MKYYDKNKREILAGMFIKHDDGDVEEVFFNGEEYGVNATNKKFMENHPDCNMLEYIYPLYQFNLKEWEIVE